MQRMLDRVGPVPILPIFYNKELVYILGRTFPEKGTVNWANKMVASRGERLRLSGTDWRFTVRIPVKKVFVTQNGQPLSWSAVTSGCADKG